MFLWMNTLRNEYKILSNDPFCGFSTRKIKSKYELCFGTARSIQSVSNICRIVVSMKVKGNKSCELMMNKTKILRIESSLACEPCQ